MKAVYLEEGAVSRGDISLEPITSIVETKVFDNTTEDDKFEHIGDAEAVFTNKVIFDEKTFERLPNLKYVGVCATGYNVIDLDAARKRGIVVTNVPAYSTESVAQLAWGFILECAGHISSHNESVHNGDWIKSETFCYWLTPAMELAGKTLGIVGYGNIGRRMAEIAAAFKMNVKIYTAHPEKYIKDGTAGAERTSDALSDASSMSFVSLEELLSESDIISLHCPMTKDTDKMINAGSISKMKDGCILINVSRGGLVDEDALAAALKSGKLAAAAVDVVSAEPMKEDNPLLTAPNIIITPHIGWASVEARTRLISTIADNFKAFLNGSPVNVVS
ncbi:MAG: D-2-hydroxyacid dehydrogenase [Eubacterium sp.]|nr:D-2-hydroxyacid dehydrogenase [Eubacterium sp.]SEG15703.1 glycerate dehydrogenase [Eubacterium ruminantium]